MADIPPSVSERILRDVKERLLHDFRIDHTTIQFRTHCLRSRAWVRDPGGRESRGTSTPQPLRNCA